MDCDVGGGPVGMEIGTGDSAGDVAITGNNGGSGFMLIFAEGFFILIFVDGFFEGLESAGSLNRSCRRPAVHNSDTRLPQPTL